MHKIGNKGTFYSGEKGTKKIGVDKAKVHQSWPLKMVIIPVPGSGHLLPDVL